MGNFNDSDISVLRVDADTQLKLDEINLGFDRLREGKAVRQVVEF